MRLFDSPPSPAARPPPRSYPGGHALFVSHRTTACRCTEGGGGYASWTTKPKWRWCQVASGSRGHVGRTPGMPLPVRNHPRVQRCKGHWSGGAGGSGLLHASRVPGSHQCARGNGGLHRVQGQEAAHVEGKRRRPVPSQEEALGSGCDFGRLSRRSLRFVGVTQIAPRPRGAKPSRQSSTS